MNSGILKRKITFQQLKNDKNEYGEPTQIWEDIATTWANITPIVGREYFAAETVNSEVSHKIRIRYRQGLKPSMRINYKDRYFQIISIINFEEKNIELQLMCKELI